MAEPDPWNPSDPRNKERTRESQSQVRALLMDWDPLGVADAPEAGDEYDCMISPLMHRLYEQVPVPELVDWIANERSTHFGLDPDADADAALAARLIAWWRHRRTEPA